ncbi:MAG TPA: hypothetical protein VN408_10595 [Actinoplanes sp.]|nr:hypothetical protein [Actinoplanes sp.]
MPDEGLLEHVFEASRFVEQAERVAVESRAVAGDDHREGASVTEPRRPIGALLLPGSGAEGRLPVDPGGPATVAAWLLADTPGVRSAHSRVVRERGRIVVVFRAVAEPHANLDDIAEAADAVTAELRTVLDRDDIAVRLALTVAARRHAISRVD